jgi:hypothetical protein
MVVFQAGAAPAKLLQQRYPHDSDCGCHARSALPLISILRMIWQILYISTDRTFLDV